MKNKKKAACYHLVYEDNGQIMIETLIVYLITFILLIFLIVLMFIMFQNWSCQIVANDTAARIGQTYKFEKADIKTGNITKEDLLDLPLYRHLSDSLKNKEAEKGNIFSTSRLSQMSFVKMSNQEFNVEVVGDLLARRHVVVTLKGTFYVPMGGILKYFGQNPNIEYEFEGIAECMDISDYMNTVDYMYSLFDSIKAFGITDLVDRIFDLVAGAK